MSVDFNFIDILIKNYWIENSSFYIMSEGIIGKSQISDPPGHPIYRQEPTRADKNRQEPSRADKRHFYAFFRLKYYLLDPIHALYIEISHWIACAAPQNKEITILQSVLLADKKSWRYTVGCHRDVCVIAKTA